MTREKIIWEQYNWIKHTKSGKIGTVVSYRVDTDEVRVRVGLKYYKWVGMNCERSATSR